VKLVFRGKIDAVQTFIAAVRVCQSVSRSIQQWSDKDRHTHRTHRFCVAGSVSAIACDIPAASVTWSVTWPSGAPTSALPRQFTTNTSKFVCVTLSAFYHQFW